MSVFEWVSARTGGFPRDLPVLGLAVSGGSDVNTSAWIQLIAFLVVLLALSWPLARWIFAAMEGRIEWLRRVERGVLKLAGVNADAEQGWLRYSLGLLIFNGLGVLAVYALQRLQQYLPLNPQGFGEVTPDSAFNTAVSFVTNTNWQGLRWRDDHELSDADARADGAELLLRRDRHRRRHRAAARLCAPQRQVHRQRLDRPDPRHAVGAAAAVLRVRHRSGRHGRRADLQALPRT